MIPAILLLGPTATGKSALAVTLAERFDGEVISVDSAQIYRGMDIGTAKPDVAIRERIAHHLLDVIDPTEAYSLAPACTRRLRGASTPCSRQDSSKSFPDCGAVTH